MLLKFATRRLRCIVCCDRGLFTSRRNYSTLKNPESSFIYSKDVKYTLQNRQPVVALESTIITHGMPYPDNLRTTLDVESIVRKHGATPATIAIINGNIHIGLNEAELEKLAQPDAKVIKTSRRDLPYVLSQKLNGGMTVSGTMIAAHQADIHVFVTGGVGGVHRGAESSMDVSADLTELGRTPVAVVSAGVKSILDIGRTLEYLETEGVCVATYGDNKDFPAFFTPSSEFKAAYNVQTPYQAAQMIHSNLSLNLGSGMLIAVPVPSEYAASGQLIESAIKDAVQEAKKLGIEGKEVTPFILQKVNEITKGKSLEANIALIKHNAEIGSQIAVELARIRESVDRSESLPKLPVGEVKESKDVKRPVVIGGINVDFTVSFKDEKIKPNGATYKGQIKPSFGGVGRNLGDCLTRLGADPIFLSAVGVDSYADLFYQQCSHMDLTKVSKLGNASTATYCAILRSTGQLIYGIGDFGIHSKIDKTYLAKHENDICNAPMVVIDGNIQAEAMQYVCDVCSNAKVPVFFEPADMTHIKKMFKSSAWKMLTYSSPNMNELRMFRGLLEGKTELIDKDSGSNADEATTIEEALILSKELLPYVPNLLVTLGEYGVLMITQTQDSESFSATHYPVLSAADHIVSVSGAGDCLAATVICGIIQGLPEDHYMRSGLVAAQKSLLGNRPIPETITPEIMDLTYVNQHTDVSYAPRIIQGDV